jgi:hypothetical protein
LNCTEEPIVGSLVLEAIPDHAPLPVSVRD